MQKDKFINYFNRSNQKSTPNELDSELFTNVALLIEKLGQNISNPSYLNSTWKALEMLIDQYNFYCMDDDLLITAYESISILSIIERNIPFSKNVYEIFKNLLMNMYNNLFKKSAHALYCNLINYPKFMGKFILDPSFLEIQKFMFENELFHECASNMIDSIRLIDEHSVNLDNVIFIMKQTFSALKRQTDDKNKIIYIHFLVSFMKKFSGVTDIMKKFRKLNGAFTMYQMLENNLTEFHKTFIELMKCLDLNDQTTPNQYISQFLALQLNYSFLSSEIYISIFEIILDIIQTDNLNINKMNKYFHFIEITNIQHLSGNKYNLYILKIFDLLIDINFESCTQILTKILSNFEHFEINYLCNIIQKMLDKNNLLKDKELIRFLCSFFLSRQRNDAFGYIITNYEVFRKLFLFTYQETNEQEHLCIAKIMDSHKLIEPEDIFIEMVIKMICYNPNSDKMMIFFAKLPELYSQKLFALFLSSIISNRELISLVIEIKGLFLIEPLFSNPLFTDQDLTNFVIALSSDGFNKQLNSMILSLDPNHRLFKMTQNYYQQIFNGYNKIEPIILPALIAFLDQEISTNSQFDYVNLGKYAIPMYYKLHKPTNLLSLVANRYLTFETVSLIFEDTSNIVRYVDSESDHFPLFEFFPNKSDSYIEINLLYQSIYFWFKCISQQQNILNIYSSGNISLILKNNQLIIKWGKFTETIQNISFNKWHFVFISFNGCTYDDETIHLIIDNNKYCFSQETPSNQTIFGHKNEFINSPWFLSTNIQYFPNAIKSMEKIIHKIIEKGYGYICKSEKHLLLGLHSNKFKMGKNATLVPYQGFAYFLKFPIYLSKFFKLIIQTNDSIHLYKLIDTAFNFLEINHFDIPNFWDYFIYITKIHCSNFNESHLQLITNFIFKKLPENQIFKVIHLLFLDVEFWIKFPSDLIGRFLNMIESNLKTTQLAKSFFSKETCMLFNSLISTVLPVTSPKELIIKFMINILLKFELKEELIIILHSVFLFSSIFNEKTHHIHQKYRLFTLQEFVRNKDILKTRYFTQELVHSIFTFGSPQEINVLIQILFILKENNPSFEYTIIIPIQIIIDDFYSWCMIFSLLTMKKFDNSNSLSIFLNSKTKLSYKNILTEAIKLVYCGAISLLYAKLLNKKIPPFLKQAVSDGFLILNNILSFKVAKNKQLFNSIITYSPLLISISNNIDLYNCYYSTQIYKFEFESFSSILFKDWNVPVKTFFTNYELPKQTKSFSLIINQIYECLNKFGIDPLSNVRLDPEEVSDFLININYEKFIIKFIVLNYKKKTNIFQGLILTTLTFSPFSHDDILYVFIMNIIEKFFEAFNNTLTKTSMGNIICILSLLNYCFSKNKIPENKIIPIFNFLTKILSNFQQKPITRSIRVLLATILEKIDIKQISLYGRAIDIFNNYQLNRKIEFSIYILFLLYQNINDFNDNLAFLYQNMYNSHFSKWHHISKNLRIIDIESINEILDDLDHFVQDDHYKMKYHEKFIRDFTHLIPSFKIDFSIKLPTFFPPNSFQRR